MRSRAREIVTISGRFKPNGSSAIANSANQGGPGWTVARTSAGVYTITLDDNYYALVGWKAALQKSTDAGHSFSLVSETVNTRGGAAVVIKYSENSAGTFAAADLTAASTTFIHFVLFLKNTAQTP